MKIVCLRCIRNTVVIYVLCVNKNIKRDLVSFVGEDLLKD